MKKKKNNIKFGRLCLLSIESTGVQYHSYVTGELVNKMIREEKKEHENQSL